MTDVPAPAKNLFEVLQDEIERITRKHERWLRYGVPAISTAVMKSEIDNAKTALASMDVEAMIIALNDLSGYSDDD